MQGNVVIAGDLNLPTVDWRNGVATQSSSQYLINDLVWEGGLGQSVEKPARGNSILDIFLLKPDDLFFIAKLYQGLLIIKLFCI